jgi:hypothetical protein
MGRVVVPQGRLLLQAARHRPGPAIASAALIRACCRSAVRADRRP